MKAACPYCEGMRNIKIIHKTENRKVRELDIEAQVEFSVCTDCGGEFSTARQMDAALGRYYEIYRQKQDLVSPQELVAIRESYGVSQKAYAKLLDLGELVINGYEQGSLITKSVSNLIRFTEKPDNFKDLFEKNKNKLTKLQIDRIEKALVENNRYSSGSPYVYMQEPVPGYNNREGSSLLAMFQLILHFAEKKIYKMALLKIAFYVDFAYFKYHGLPVSGWKYASIDHGPVPQDWKKLLHEGQELNFFTYEMDDQDMGDLYFLTGDFQYKDSAKRFTPDQIDMIKTVTEKLKDKTATQLRKLSHDEDAWKQTEHAKIIDYNLAKTLKAF